MAIVASLQSRGGDGRFAQRNPANHHPSKDKHRNGAIQLRSSILEPRVAGDGVEKRLLQAAEAGDAGAQYNIGILYDNGLDDNGYAVTGNRPQAVRWLLAAAEQGLPRAQLKLAEVYADAPDKSGSSATTAGWFLLAAQGLRGAHLQRARSGYERVASHLTPVQITEAERFAQDWMPKPPARVFSQNTSIEEVCNEGLVCSADRDPDPDRREPRRVRLASGFPWRELTMADDPDDALLARNVIEVHGAEAAVIARGNARDSAVAGQPAQAKSWIRVLGIIQRQRADKEARPRKPPKPRSPLPSVNPTKG